LDGIYGLPFLKANAMMQHEQEQANVWCLPLCNMSKSLSMSSACLLETTAGTTQRRTKRQERLSVEQNGIDPTVNPPRPFASGG
jgi:hypothetical protein